VALSARASDPLKNCVCQQAAVDRILISLVHRADERSGVSVTTVEGLANRELSEALCVLHERRRFENLKDSRVVLIFTSSKERFLDFSAKKKVSSCTSTF
jgi:hypothetical protein